MEQEWYILNRLTCLPLQFSAPNVACFRVSMSLIWGRILENGASVYSVEEQVVEAIGGPDGYLSSLGTEKDELSITLMNFLLVYDLFTSRRGGT